MQTLRNIGILIVVGFILAMPVTCMMAYGQDDPNDLWVSICEQFPPICEAREEQEKMKEWLLWLDENYMEPNSPVKPEIVVIRVDTTYCDPEGDPVYFALRHYFAGMKLHVVDEDFDPALFYLMDQVAVPPDSMMKIANNQEGSCEGIPVTFFVTWDRRVLPVYWQRSRSRDNAFYWTNRDPKKIVFSIFVSDYDKSTAIRLIVNNPQPEMRLKGPSDAIAKYHEIFSK